MKLGFINAESNQELEDNSKIQAEWKFFKPVCTSEGEFLRKNRELIAINRIVILNEVKDPVFIRI